MSNPDTLKGPTWSSALSAESPLLTVAEAARFARVSNLTMYRRVWSGQVPAIRVGEGRSAIRIPRADFERWLFGPPQDDAA
jgi:excisionase family DNA binding protein